MSEKLRIKKFNPEGKVIAWGEVSPTIEIEFVIDGEKHKDGDILTAKDIMELCAE